MKKYLQKMLVLTLCVQAALYAGGTEPSEYLAQLPRVLQQLIISFVEQMPVDLEAAIKLFAQQLAGNTELSAFTGNPIVLEAIVRSYVQRFGPQAALQELTKAIDRADEPVIRALLSTGAIAINDYGIKRDTDLYTPLGYALLVSPVDTVPLATRVLPVLEQFGADTNKTASIPER